MRRRGLYDRRGTSPERHVAAILASRGVAFTREASVVGIGCRTRIDFFVPAARLAIYVDGCFWHGHEHATSGRRIPAAWRAKIAETRARDAEQTRRLAAAGLCVLRLWECRIDSGAIAAVLAARGGT